MKQKKTITKTEKKEKKVTSNREETEEKKVIPTKKEKSTKPVQETTGKIETAAPQPTVKVITFTTEDKLFSFKFTFQYSSSGSLQKIEAEITYNISPPVLSKTYDLSDFADHEVEVTLPHTSPPTKEILWGTLRQQSLSGTNNGIWFNIFYAVDEEPEPIHHIEGIFVIFPKEITTS